MHSLDLLRSIVWFQRKWYCLSFMLLVSWNAFIANGEACMHLCEHIESTRKKRNSRSNNNKFPFSHSLQSNTLCMEHVTNTATSNHKYIEYGFAISSFGMSVHGFVNSILFEMFIHVHTGFQLIESYYRRQVHTFRQCSWAHCVKRKKKKSLWVKYMASHYRRWFNTVTPERSNCVRIMLKFCWQQHASYNYRPLLMHAVPFW